MTLKEEGITDKKDKGTTVAEGINWKFINDSCKHEMYFVKTSKTVLIVESFKRGKLRVFSGPNLTFTIPVKRWTRVSHGFVIYRVYIYDY